jgi:putative membrane-bound dehydrogenase-like protein
MKLRPVLVLVLVLFSLNSLSGAENALRVFLRGGKKTHGPAGNGLHDHEVWMNDWQKLLTERGAKVDGALSFPTAEQLDNTDVLAMFAAEAGSIAGDNRANLDKFLKRGGGLVCIHDAVCGTNAPWFKTVIGGAWEHGHSKWFEGDVSFYYVDSSHPITDGCSNFDFDDEVYWDLHLMPEAKILGVSWQPDRRNTRAGRPNPHIYNVIPQMWTYENKLEGAAEGYRAFVSIPGHKYSSFNLPHYRAVLLRGMAWAGKRANLDEFVSKTELASLRYPEGGPTSPEKAAAKLELHPEFKMDLAAAEPLVNKPIAIDWDPAGRMWVAETPEYPNGRRGLREQQRGIEWKDHGGLVGVVGTQERPARDRISILIDTDHDGRADRKEIFYEGLDLVTGFVFHRDGVIVSQAPDILYLRDTNGDGKADKVEKLYTNLGINDTHAVINNLRWGYDGWIYATHGYSASDHVRNGDGARDFGRITSGVIRFKPDGSAIEQYSSKGGNTWGLDFGWDNEVLFTQPTSGDLLNHVVMSEAALARGKAGNTLSYKPLIVRRKSYPLIKSENLAYVQIDLVGSFTASAGSAIYDGGAWPESWNYNYFTTEPTINIVHHEEVKPQGSSFTAAKTREAEFIGGRDLWFRPIETRIGPDGALYLLDFYNQAVIHNDTRGPMHNAVNAAVRPDRDHYFGRIWRVQHKQARTLTIPDLSKASLDQLVAGLQHPNRAVRMNAQRLLVERNDAGLVKALTPLLRSMKFRGLEAAKLQALWVLHLTQKLDADFLKAALAADGKPAVQKNALRIAAVSKESDKAALAGDVLKRLRDTDDRVRLEAFLALSSMPVTEKVVAEVLALYPDLKDRWMESAAIGLASQAPQQFIEGALTARNAEELVPLARLLAAQVAGKGDAAAVGRLVIAVARQVAAPDALRQGILETLATESKVDVVPAWSNDLENAFRTLLSKSSAAVASAALPLAARYDTRGRLKDQTRDLLASLSGKLNDEKLSDEQRGRVVTSLVGVRQLDADILPSVGKLLGSSASKPLQRTALEALGNSGDAAAGKILTKAYPKLGTELQEPAFSQLIRRADWSLDLLDGIKGGSIPATSLSPASVHRLRRHNDAAVAKRANDVFDELRGPELKEKSQLIAKLSPEVERPGNVENGKKFFAQNCAVCHKFGGEGKEVGPDLTGMGAHGPAELLVAVLDPNREVDPSFVSWSFETQDGEIYDGLIASENRSTITLRNNSGETSIKVSDVRARRNTGRSVMPEGFESLGGESLRDLLAYVCASDSRFRVLDLRVAYTADSSKGIFASAENKEETLSFQKFGLIKAGEIPFDILNPEKTAQGKNLIVLKGRNGICRDYPQKVEINGGGVKATKLHFLGGVGGWAWPCCGDSNEKVPVAKVTISHGSGKSEEFVFQNGVEFVDYINAGTEVPGSKEVPGLLRRGQVRHFSRPLQYAALAIEKITIESYNNQVAPTFVAITAETAETGAAPNASADAQEKSEKPAARSAESSSGSAAAAPMKWGAGIKALLLGGGASHDYPRWFGQADTATLQEGGLASANYTEDVDLVATEGPQADVLVISNNKPFKNPASRKAIMEHVNAGKGVVIVHPGLWYNWSDWPEYNRELSGGGARGHDRFGEFDVNLTDVKHAVTEGVPASFRITDECYWFEPDAKGTAIEVLATGYSAQKKKDYPMVFIVKHPKARIVGLTLGHDGKAHELDAYKTLLRNSVRWAAGK